MIFLQQLLSARYTKEVEEPMARGQAADPDVEELVRSIFKLAEETEYIGHV